MKQVLAALLLLWTLASPSSAQQDVSPPNLSAVERKNLAPVSKDILKVSLPRPIERKLSNGLTVLIVEDHRLPLISLQFNIGGAGPVYDPSDLPGLANVTAQMLREGTTSRKSLQIAEESELLGASVSAGSGYGSSAATVSASGLSDNFDKWFALATDVLLNPSFPADELGRLKQRIKVQLRQQRASANFLSNERFSRAVYGTHPAAIVTTTEAAIDALTPEKLAQWHREKYLPQNAVLGVAGDVHSTDLIAELEKALAPWKKTDAAEVLPPNPRPASERKVMLVNRPNSVQTSLVIGNIAIDRRDPDYIPLVVANHVFGGGITGRLSLNLREAKGYTYGIGSGLSALKWPGPWRTVTAVRSEVTEGAMTEFFQEIKRFRDELTPEKELDEAKRAIVASFALSLEDPDQVLGYYIVRSIYKFPADYWDSYAAKVMAVTPADIQRVVRKYLNPDAFQVVAVGDASKIKEPMEKFGTVEVYDTEGKKLN